MYKLAVRSESRLQGNPCAASTKSHASGRDCRVSCSAAQRYALLLFAAGSGFLAGCPTGATFNRPATPSASSTNTKDAEESGLLLNRIDAVLANNLKHRQLATNVHGAWQIMHGILAYGRDFTITSPEGPVVAVDYVLRGGPVKGFELRSGDRFDPPAAFDPPAPLGTDDGPALQTRGIRVEVDPGSKLGQGHRDQWLAYMAACQLPLDQVIQTLDGPRRLDLWVRQIEWDVPLNFEREFSWTLMSILPYRETSHRWTARDGKDYSIESLLRSEVDQLSPDSACGGSHRLVAISKALNKRRLEAGPIHGVWADAQFLVDSAIDQAVEFQNGDGTFSSNYFERSGWSLDMATAIGTTGHTLELIAVAGSDHIIRDAAVTKAASTLCRLLEQTAHVDLECGALYHALSGLQLYRRRLAATASS